MSKKRKVFSRVIVEHRNAIVRLLRAGFNNATVLVIYPEYTRQQIAAIKAHITMKNL